MSDEVGTFRSGFVAVVGRPNVGKSTLVNQLVGRKVSIVSPRPQTTRTEIRGVRTTATSQIVFLDTPGIHKPRTLLGERTNSARPRHARRGRRRLPRRRGERADRPRRPVHRRAGAAVSSPSHPRRQQGRPRVRSRPSSTTSRWRATSSASSTRSSRSRRVTGDGVDALVAELEPRLPEGPHYYPDGVVTDQPETFLAAELLREQLLRVARDELPHSIAVVVEPLDEDDEPRPGRAAAAPGGRPRRARVARRASSSARAARCSRRPGRTPGSSSRRCSAFRVYLETRVQVDPDWQRRPKALDRLGF